MNNEEQLNKIIELLTQTNKMLGSLGLIVARISTLLIIILIITLIGLIFGRIF